MTRLVTAIFGHVHPKRFWSAFNFWESVSTCKNQFIPSAHSSDSQFQNSAIRQATFIFEHAHPKNLNQLLSCVDFYQLAKIQLILSVHSWDSVNFRVPRPDWSHPFLTMPNKKCSINFSFLWIFCKKWGCFINLSWRNSWLRNYAIWLGDSILAHISGTFFLNMGFSEEHSKQYKFSL